MCKSLHSIWIVDVAQYIKWLKKFINRRALLLEWYDGATAAVAMVRCLRETMNTPPDGHTVYKTHSLSSLTQSSVRVSSSLYLSLTHTVTTKLTTIRSHETSGKWCS